MAWRVWKYKLPIDDNVTIQIKVAAHVLCVAEQDGSICLWAIVNPEDEDEDRYFRIAGTGHPIESHRDWDYIGTVHNVGGMGLVFHVFEKIGSIPPYVG